MDAQDELKNCSECSYKVLKLQNKLIKSETLFHMFTEHNKHHKKNGEELRKIEHQKMQIKELIKRSYKDKT